MTQARVQSGRVGAFEALFLENEFVRAVVIPELGARVWVLEDRLRGRQWIWHSEDVPLTKSMPGSVYDDVWAGGWEELFPNDAPGAFEGRMLLDHGEWWTMPWRLDRFESGSVARVSLSASSRGVRATCRKDLLLAEDTAVLQVRYRITSHEPLPFHFLFKQHLAVLITADCRLALPGGCARAVEEGFGTRLASREPFTWPAAFEASGRLADLRVIPPRASQEREFVYVSDLPEAWCAVDDYGSQASIRMSFDQRQLPFVWLFLSYGGWRRTYTAVLEPCTNMPKDLGEAVRLGQCARLDPGEEFATEVNVALGPVAESQ